MQISRIFTILNKFLLKTKIFIELSYKKKLSKKKDVTYSFVPTIRIIMKNINTKKSNTKKYIFV